MSRGLDRRTAQQIYVAQQTRKEMRAGDHAYRQGAVIDTDDRVAPQMTLLELRMLSFVFPMPPSVNALYGTAQNGQKFLLGDQKQFRREVIGIVRLQLRGQERAEVKLLGRVEVRVTFYFADRRRTDVSNRLKALEDALTHAGAYEDDSQIDRIIAERVIRHGPEECAVVLKEIAA